MSQSVMQDESERRQRPGEHVAPAGLYATIKARPCLGNVACSHDRLVAGSWHETALTYEVGAGGIADGATFEATFKFNSDWALFQAADPSAGSLRLSNDSPASRSVRPASRWPSSHRAGAAP